MRILNQMTLSPSSFGRGCIAVVLPVEKRWSALVLYGCTWIPSFFLTFCINSIFYPVLHSVDCFSFTFSNIISIFSQEISNSNKVFFIRKKYKYWSLSVTSETYNEAYNKPTNLPHIVGNLGSKIYVPWLLLIITLCFTCGKINFGAWLKSSKILWPGW